MAVTQLADSYTDGAELDMSVLDKDDTSENDARLSAVIDRSNGNTTKEATPEPDTKAKEPAGTTAKTEEKETPKADEKQPEPDEIPDGWKPEHYKAFKDTKAYSTKLAMENAELRRQQAKIQAESAIAKASAQSAGFTELDADDLSDLKQQDPDAYIEYMTRKNQVDAGQGRVNQIKEEETNKLLDISLLMAVSELVGAEGVDYEKPIVGQNPEIDKMVNSPELKKSIQYMVVNFVPDENNVWSPEQIKDAYFLANREKVLADHRMQAVETVKSNIKNASAGGSVLDRVQKETNRPEVGKTVYDKMSAQELAGQGMDFIEQADKELHG